MPFLVELAIPVLSSVSTGVGAAVLGYRLRRRAKKVRAAAKRAATYAKDLHEARKEILSVRENAKSIYSAVTSDLDVEALKKALESVKDKYHLRTEKKSAE